MQEKENVLRILKEAKIGLDKGDSALLRDLSNQTINTASRTHDADNIAVAVIVYSLGKVVEREEYKKHKHWVKFFANIKLSIDGVIYSIEKNEDTKLAENLQRLRNSLSNLSGELKNYIQDVFRKASINKASRIYEHGISMEKTAKLLGITVWELASYVGQRNVANGVGIKTTDTKSRIKLAMEMFG